MSKKDIIGFILLALDLIIMVVGVAFSIVVPLLSEWSIVTETMHIIGFIGIGATLGSLLLLIAESLIGDK